MCHLFNLLYVFSSNPSNIPSVHHKLVVSLLWYIHVQIRKYVDTTF